VADLATRARAARARQRRLGALSPDERIVFQHIPKAAGSSVIGALNTLFEPHQVVMGATREILRSLSEEQLAQIRLVTGHLTAKEVDSIPGPKRVLTFLREPAARILSLYYFWKSMTAEFAANMAGPPLAKQRSLLEFLRSSEPVVRSNIENGITRRFIAGRALAADSSVMTQTTSESLAEMAMRRLRSYHFVGFQETFDEDVAAMLRGIGHAPRNAPRNNMLADLPETDARYERSERESITPDIEAELARLTTADSILYAMAFAERDRWRSKLP
jgi:hypothetical protein